MGISRSSHKSVGSQTVISGATELPLGYKNDFYSSGSSEPQYSQSDYSYERWPPKNPLPGDLCTRSAESFRFVSLHKIKKSKGLKAGRSFNYKWLTVTFLSMIMFLWVVFSEEVKGVFPLQSALLTTDLIFDSVANIFTSKLVLSHVGLPTF